MLSPLLFITLIDELIKKCKVNVKYIMIGYRNLPVRISKSMFTDDLMILGGSKKNLHDRLEANNEGIWYDKQQAKST